MKNPFSHPLRCWTASLSAMLAVTALVAGCGGGDVTFGGGDDDDDKKRVTVTGTIDDVVPVTTRDIVVFVYTNLQFGADGTTCPLDTFDDGEVAVVDGGSSEFALDDVDGGDLSVLFLLDDPGDTADGTIDPGDSIAVLRDEDDILEDVRNDFTVTIDDIDIDFAPYDPAQADCTDDAGGDDGVADPRLISKSRNPAL